MRLYRLLYLVIFTVYLYIYIMIKPHLFSGVLFVLVLWFGELVKSSKIPRYSKCPGSKDNHCTTVVECPGVRPRQRRITNGNAETAATRQVRQLMSVCARAVRRAVPRPREPSAPPRRRDGEDDAPAEAARLRQPPTRS